MTTQDSTAAPGPARESYRVSELIDYHNLAEVRKAGEAFIDQVEGESVTFDLAGAAGSGSPGVAAMMAWFRYCRHSGKMIAFVGLPLDLSNIIDVSGLAKVLPITGEPG